EWASSTNTYMTELNELLGVIKSPPPLDRACCKCSIPAASISTIRCRRDSSRLINGRHSRTSHGVIFGAQARGAVWKGWRFMGKRRAEGVRRGVLAQSERPQF